MAEFDFCVIGSGPGGYVAAIRAAQLGLTSCVIEKAEIGGVCLNWGCIPTKALLESAHFLAKLQNNRFGIQLSTSAKPDLSVMVQRSRQIAQRLSTGIEHLFKKYGVSFFQGEATLAGSQTVIVKKPKQPKEETKLQARFLVIATGARPRLLPELPSSSKIWTYKEALTPKVLPKKLLIVGAGAIGCEFADFYASLGCQVFLVELAEHILPLEEPYLAKILKTELEKKGIQVLEKTQVESWDLSKETVQVKLRTPQGPQTKEVDNVLVAIGVLPNTENLNLSKVGIQLTSKGTIPTNSFGLVEGQSHIFAIGDVAGGKQLAHKASREGVVAAEFAAHWLNPSKHKKPQPLLAQNIPSCIYTSPQVASLGFTEAELKAQEIPYNVGEFPFLASGKALALGANRGSSRVYVHKKTGEILGAHLIGPDVTEIIGALSVAQAGELTTEEFLLSVFPHPTISESLHEAIAQAFGESPNL